MAAGQITFGLVGKAMPQQVGDNETQDPVAEKFETLVVGASRTAPPAVLPVGSQGARVNQRLAQQFGPGEIMPENPAQGLLVQ